MKSSKLLLASLLYCLVLLLFNCAKDDPILDSGNNTQQGSNNNNGNTNPDPDPNSDNALLYLKNTDNYSIFYSAIVRADLENELNIAGPITVFAPNNVAFTAFMENNGWSSVNDISPGVLKTIISFHISNIDEFMSSDLTHGKKIQILYQDRDIQVNLDGQDHPQLIAGLTKAFVIDMDYEVENGVVHEIDGVLSL